MYIICNIWGIFLLKMCCFSGIQIQLGCLYFNLLHLVTLPLVTQVSFCPCHLSDGTVAPLSKGRVYFFALLKWG